MNDENKLEKLFKKYNEEMKRHTSALNEEFQSRLSGVAEGVIGLSEKFDLLNEKVDFLNEKVDRIEQVQNFHTDILNEHTEILKSHTEKLDSHTEMIGVQMEDISETKIELENKVDKKEFIELKQTVLAMAKF
ncbi:MAG: hypothetical protein NT098_03675 [Candidatus Parcubacteria bacterium]|nr:hypothetical protein [Candidatus Parcubacteria bacterium]